MAILQNVKMVYGAYAIQADFNSVTCRPQRQMLENTRWTNNSRRREPGLRDIEMSANGYFNMVAGDTGIHDIINILRGTVTPITVAASGAVGTVAYTKPCLAANYDYLNGSVGDKHNIAVSFDTAGEAFRGTIVQALGNITATTTTDDYELGAGTANDVIWAAVHVVLNSAPDTVTVTIESDADTAFATPTVQDTFTAITTTAGGAEIRKVFDGRVDTPITDTFWRAVITLGAAGPVSCFVTIGKLTIV